MLDQIKLLTGILVSVKSMTGQVNNLNLAMEVALQELDKLPHKKFVSNQIPSLLFYNTSKQPEKFKIILNGHLDVTPGPEKFFHAVQKDGKLYGKGIYDMKAASAVLILLYKELHDKINYPLGLQLVADEEIGGYNGTKHQLEKGITTDFALSGDATDFKVVNNAKGLYWIKICAKGTTDHSAYPWNADNALWKMKKFLDKLEKAFPNPTKESWVTTINLAKIETTNVTFNEIPSDACAWIDMRCIPEEHESAIKKLQELIPADFTFEVPVTEPAAYVPPNNIYVQKLQAASEKITGTPTQITRHHGGSDARLFAAKGMYAAEFGPRGGRLPDGNEWVDIKNLEDYYNSLKEFLLSLNK